MSSPSATMPLPVVKPEREKTGIKGAETEEKRRALAIELERLLDAAFAQQGSRRTRNERLMRFYYNVPPNEEGQELPFVGAANHQIPLIQPIVDSVNDGVIQPIVESPVYFFVEIPGEGGKRAEDVENDLTFLMNRGGFPLALWNAAPLIAVNGLVHLRVPFEVRFESFLAGPSARGDPLGTNVEATGGIRVRAPDGRVVPLAAVAFAGPVYEVHHMDDTAVWPLNVKELARARLIAHRFQIRVGEIREHQRAGLYFADVSVVNTSTRRPQPAVEEVQSLTAVLSVGDDPLDDVPDLYTGLYKKDLNEDGYEEWYEFVVAKEQHALLDIRSYELPLVWYADLRYHFEHNAYIPQGSVAQNLQGLQIAYNEFHNILDDGAVLSYGGPVFAEAGTQGAQVEKYAPFQVRYVEDPTKIKQVNPDFDPAGAMAMIQQIERRATVSSGASENRQSLPGATGQMTATEVSRLSFSSDRRESGLRMRLAPALVNVGYITLQHYRANFDLLKALYGDMLRTEAVEHLQRPLRLRLAATDFTTNPAQQIGMIRAVLEFLAEAVKVDPQVLKRVKIVVLLKALFDASQLSVAEQAFRSEEEAEDWEKLQAIRALLGEILAAAQEQPGPDVLVQGIERIGAILDGDADAGIGSEAPPLARGLGGVLGQPGMAGNIAMVGGSPNGEPVGM